MKYVSRGVEVEAFKWTGKTGINDMPGWVRNALQKSWGEPGSARIVRPAAARACMEICAAGGSCFAEPGDFVVMDSSGEIFSCKPDFFEAIYKAP
jgi:hypothetical protein